MAKQGQIQGVTFEEVVERGCGLEVHNTLRVLYIIASWGSTWLSDSYGKGFVRTRGAEGEVANMVSTIFLCTYTNVLRIIKSISGDMDRLLKLQSYGYK